LLANAGDIENFFRHGKNKYSSKPESRHSSQKAIRGTEYRIDHHSTILDMICSRIAWLLALFVVGISTSSSIDGVLATTTSGGVASRREESLTTEQLHRNLQDTKVVGNNGSPSDGFPLVRLMMVFAA